MPKIDFTFQGNVRGATITQATGVKGNPVDVRQMPAPTLERLLNAGELFITLGDHLYENDEAEIEISDFEMTPGWPDEV